MSRMKGLLSLKVLVSSRRSDPPDNNPASKKHQGDAPSLIPTVRLSRAGPSLASPPADTGAALHSARATTQIYEGRVIFVDPDDLLEKGARVTVSDPISGAHYFLCIKRWTSKCYLVPLTSKPGFGREEIEGHFRFGSGSFLSGRTFARVNEVWFVSISGLCATMAVKDGLPHSVNRGELQRLTDLILAKPLRFVKSFGPRGRRPLKPEPP
jgi:hypothetical protein